MSSRGPHYEDLSDEELVRLFRDVADNSCFAELFRRHSRKVYHACFAFFRDASLAEDATQETFLRAYQNEAQFHGGDYVGWLHRIARNPCIDQWKKKRPETPIDDTEEGVLGQILLTPPDADMQLALKELEKEMDQLPVEQRRCLELKIQGYSYEETAAQMGVTMDAVRSHLQNGRRTLRLRIQKVLAP
jgi:RNA polymerase sigma factor (sigma-70 family)